MAHIIAVTNQKGGVGKTTTCSALVSGLTALGQRTLGIDLDPQGNLGFSLGIDIESGDSIYDVMKGTVTAEDALLRTENGDVIPSNILLSSAELEFNRSGREYIIRDLIATIEERYDYIIIDTNWATSPLMINARTAVDGDGAHLFCFRLTFCIHPDIIKITSEYSWYTGAYPIVMGEKGSRVRIPHKAVAVLAECLSAMSLGCLFREDGEVRLNV